MLSFIIKYTGIVIFFNAFVFRKPDSIDHVLEPFSRLYQRLNSNNIPDTMICKICYDKEIQVAIIPCCHAFSCIQCAMKQTLCSVCREPYTSVLKLLVPVDKEPGRTEPSKVLSVPLDLDELVDQTQCTVCQKEKINATSIPCNHASTCVKCLTETEKCPVCNENICGFIQFYL